MFLTGDASYIIFYFLKIAVNIDRVEVRKAQKYVVSRIILKELALDEGVLYLLLHILF